MSCMGRNVASSGKDVPDRVSRRATLAIPRQYSTDVATRTARIRLRISNCRSVSFESQGARLTCPPVPADPGSLARSPGDRYST